MAPTLVTTATAAERVRADMLAVPVFADRRLGPGAEAVDAALGAGTLTEFMAETDFNAKLGETLSVPTHGRLGAKAVVLIGVGEQDKLDADAMRRVGAAIAKRASKVKTVATTLLDAAPASFDRADAAQALAEGVVLGGYKFLKYKADATPSTLTKVQLIGGRDAKVRAALDRGVRIAQAVASARDLVNEPADAKSPEDIANSRLASGREEVGPEDQGARG